MKKSVLLLKWIALGIVCLPLASLKALAGLVAPKHNTCVVRPGDPMPPSPYTGG